MAKLGSPLLVLTLGGVCGLNPRLAPNHLPELLAKELWQKNLRGDYHNVCDQWLEFDPTLYHCLEPVTSGRRVSLALFSPRSWLKLAPHALTELADLGFYPPLAAHLAQTAGESVNSSHAVDGQEAQDSDLKELNALEVEEDEPQPLIEPSAEDEAILQEMVFRRSGASTFLTPAIVRRNLVPLTEAEAEELRNHIASGHVTKSNLCRGCLTAEGPRRIHRSIRDIDRATHVLHIDLAGPMVTSEDNYHYFMVGALRLPGYPLLIDVKLLQTRTSAEVCHRLERMTAFFESLTIPGLPLGDTPRIRRLHSDRAGEFTSKYFETFLTNHKSIFHSLTSGYNPQANGTAERAVGLVKALASRCLSASGLGSQFWSFSVLSAAQALICSALQRSKRHHRLAQQSSASRSTIPRSSSQSRGQ